MLVMFLLAHVREFDTGCVHNVTMSLVGQFETGYAHCVCYQLNLFISLEVDVHKSLPD